MFVLLGVALLCAILFIVVICSFAQMPLWNDKIIYNEDGTVKEKIVGVNNYKRSFNRNGSGEGLPEMPKFLTVTTDITSVNNNVEERTVCKETMFYVPIQYTGDTSLETLRENKTFNTERNFNIIVNLCKALGYAAVAMQAIHIALCAVVKEQ